MSERVAVVWDDALAAYDFGPEHPLNPLRVQLAYRLIDEFGLLEGEQVEVLRSVLPATEADLLRVHTPAYVDAVRAASEPDAETAAVQFGLGTPDVPVFAGMHDAAARVVGATLAAAYAVGSGSVQHAVNIAGGLHHAMPDAASGFCVYNDVAASIAWLLVNGEQRIAYIDVDVHHGDGVQRIFWDDPRVLTISIHESPRSLFPGTGYPDETGGAPGSAVNIALPAGTGDQGWLRAFHGVVPELLRAFRPQIIVSQHGCDTHMDDPLAHLAKSLDGQRMAYEAIHSWAHRFCDGRWLATGGGGYELVDVVPRAWTHLVAEAVGRRIPPETRLPLAYLAYVSAALGRVSPARMTDGRTPWPKSIADGLDEHDPVDAAIWATRRAVYPLHGLNPDPWA